MIYSIYVAQFVSIYSDAENIKRIVRLIKNAPEEDKFLAVATSSQIEAFRALLSKHELNNLIQYQSPAPFTNGSHADFGKRLYLFVLSKTELKESEYGFGTNTRGKVGSGSMDGTGPTPTGNIGLAS